LVAYYRGKKDRSRPKADMGMTETRLHIRLQPGARKNEVMAFQGDVLRARVTAPPHEGRANQALLELLSDLLDIPKSRIAIVRGHTSRDKVVDIEGASLEEVIARLRASG